MSKIKIIRTSTIPMSLNVLLKGQLRFLSNFFEIIGVSSKGEDLIEVGNRERIKTISVEMQREISLFKDLISLIKLYRVFIKEKPQIVHSITPKAGLLSMLAAKLAGVPIRIHTFTGLIFPTRTGAMKKLLIKMDQLLCWAATDIYPEGYGVKKDLISYKITGKPLKVLANGNVNGIDLEHFNGQVVTALKKEKVKNQLKIEEQDFVFIFVGRLVRDKGVNELVEAFARIEQKNVKLLLVGSFESNLDPLEKRTLRLISVNPNIVCVGFQKDVRPYFAIADALVFPSYREGFPNVVMQAGAMELPSIVSNISGCNEIIIEEQNGLIVPVQNSNAVLYAMERIMKDSALYFTLKNKARPMIQSRYEQSIVWNALLEEYQNQINKLYK